DGRSQPYFGNKALKSLTTIVPPPPATEAQHTFNALNNQVPNYSAPPGNFSWPVHLDRQLASPMDLLHVSGFKPHEMTQEFVNPTGALKPFNHRVPWFDEDIPSPASASHRLNRFFEFVETRGRSVASQSQSPVAGPPLPGPATVLTAPVTFT